MSENVPENLNGIAGKPLYAKATTPGHVFDSLQAANTRLTTAPSEPSRPTIQKREGLSPIRTFESDVADAVEHNQASLVKVVVAEKERKENSPQNKSVHIVTPYTSEQKPKHSILFPLISIVMILGLSGGGYWWYTHKSKTPPPAPAPIITPSLVHADIIKTVPVGEEKIRLSAANLEEIPAEHTLVDMTFTKNGTAINAQQFATLLGTSMPSFFIRALDPSFAAGLHFIPSGYPYIVFKTSSYDNAFAGMLAWEPSLFSDLTEFFGLDPSLIPQKQFQDTIINNKNARVLVDNTGIRLLMYAFIDTKTVVITTNEETLKEIARRLR